jgi:hypothetical protein
MRRLTPAAAVAVALSLSAAAAGPGRASIAAVRAQRSLDAMERYLFDRRSGDYREAVGVKAGSHAWPFSQALAAHVSVARLPRGHSAVRKRLVLLERRFRKGTTYTAWPGGDLYLDDNEWLAQDLLDLKRPALRRRARAIFEAVVAAWDRSRQHPCAGGVYWTTTAANRDRNTVSTANGALVGLRLYRATRAPRYLTWSRRMLAWVERCMHAHNGLYWDHIGLEGRVDRTHWSYNQGSMIGAYLELYGATGNARALGRAEAIADAAVDYFESRWYTGEPPEFAAIFFRHLLALAHTAGRPDYVDIVDAYGERMWRSSRSRHTGLFSFNGRRTLLQQAALVQIYAALARAGR